MSNNFGLDLLLDALAERTAKVRAPSSLGPAAAALNPAHESFGDEPLAFTGSVSARSGPVRAF